MASKTGKTIRVFMILCMVLLNVRIVAQPHASTTDQNKISEFNRCSHLTVNDNEDTISTAVCIKCRRREYSCQTTYFENRPSFLMIYFNGARHDKQVAEFHYNKNKGKWERYDYNVKSVSYRKRLLKKYLTKGSVQYEQIELYNYD